ncbi:MAG: hypothetical protein AAFV53_09720 [Myxococcota bacterium]
MPVWIGLFLSACSEYDIQPQEELVIAPDTAQPPVVIEPPDCSVELGSIGSVIQDPDCAIPVVEVDDPWSVAVEWQWQGLSTSPNIAQVMMLPAVGNLTDDDGDGLVTEQDTPDIVAIAFDGDEGRQAEASGPGPAAPAQLVLLSGDGTEHWALPGFYWKGGPAIANVTGDARAEILAFNDERQVVAIAGNGETLWTSPERLRYDYPHINVADLDGDGFPEVLADDVVLSGRDGSVKFRLSYPAEMIGRMTVAADLDQDGRQEIIAGNTCYDANGQVLWQSPILGTYGHWAAILNVDDDPEGEVAMVGEGLLGIYDSDGTELNVVAAGTRQPGPPCVADFDGDEEAEIGWASGSRFNLYELDGTVKWTQSIIDASGLAGCSGYDIDADGAYEVIYADERQIYVFDGTTGQIRFTQGGHASGTIFEYPLVADVDNDDSAEIVLSSNNFRQGLSGWAGITVFGHDGDGWARSGPTWNVHDFAVTNIEQNGRVPQRPEPSWQLYNVYRARPAEDLLAVDLYGEVSDICFASCEPDAIVRVAGHIANQGATRARGGIPVTLYRVDGSSRTRLAVHFVEEAIDAGTHSADFEFEIRVQDIGDDGLEVWADDVGAGFGVLEECDEWNNGAVRWHDNPCDRP